MTSSMLTGDRRWAPARKSGMTVLGKVPKPINLPSQRLENHGLDPTVEIVPKGTITWGSRPSSAAPNAWGTSNTLSPNTDGSVGSPSHASGRPSSGGSGTRPSTAGSDKSLEPVSNTWGPHSRPSSASGILASSQISASATRPRSAETRPGSSQLSRFADNSVDSTVAWGGIGIAERLGNVSSKTSGFTLSSGDFPTLGSEKNSDSHTHRGHSSQGRPASASGTDSVRKETLEPQPAGNRIIDHSDHGTVNTWKADNHPYVGHGVSPNMDNWHRDSHQAQPYTNMNMPPHQYDSWHNPPFHPADGAWFRGGAAGGPYRPPGPPGSYPIDYQHVTTRPIQNPQAIRPEAGPGGYHPNNCEAYHHNIPPERCMGPSQSDIPVRTGAYPGPVPYEGYYGPPRPSLYNLTDREVSIMGMARPVYNQYPTQQPNLNAGNFHARPGGYATVVSKEQMKSDQFHENLGQYRVLLKPQDGLEDRDARAKWEHSVTAGPKHLEMGKQPGASRQEGDWRTKSQKQETAVHASSVSVCLVPGEAVSSQPSSGVDGQSTDTVVRNSLENSSKVADDGVVRKPEAANIRSRALLQYPVIKKNATLMEKVEGLNTKARIADSQSEGGPFSSKGTTKCFNDVTASADQFTKVICANATSADNAPSSNMAINVPNELNVLTEDKNREPTGTGKVLSAPSKEVGVGENAPFVGLKKVHGAKGVDHCAKLRSNRHDNDEWMKKSLGSESSVNTTMTSGKSGAGICASKLDASQVAELELLHAATDGDGSHTPFYLDPVDPKAQRAKIKVLAIQRAKQLQKEEEERTREQKAKALAKLEELNRRTSAASSKLKLNQCPQSNDVLNHMQDPEPSAASKADTTYIEPARGNLASHSEATKHADDSGIKKPGQSTDFSTNVTVQAASSATQASVMPQDQSLSLEQETDATKITHKNSSDIHNNTNSKKQVGYRRKQSIPQENSMGDKQTTTGSSDSPKYTGKLPVNASSNDTSPNNEELSVQQRKKTNRSGRNTKNRLDEGVISSNLPSPLHIEGNSEKRLTESRKTKPSTSATEATSVHSFENLNETVEPQSSREVPVTPFTQGLLETNEETHSRVINHWKPHPHRKSARTTHQGNKPVFKYHGTEFVIWAPVKPLSKSETSEEVSQNNVMEATYPSGQTGNDVQNGMKAKRAEIERYVPKPVAKELLQQVNSQQSSSSLGQAASSDMTGKSETVSPSVESGRLDCPAVGKTVAAFDTRSGENTKLSKHGKTNASWRQRSSAESPSVEDSVSSDQAKAVQKAADQLQPLNIDSLQKGQFTQTADGWNDNNDKVPPSESVTSTAVAKNNGASRQRRQPYKVNRVSGSNYPTSDNMDSQQGVADKSVNPSSALGLNESDGRKVARTESQNVGAEHMRSHWQPKLQTYTHARQGNRGSGGQRVSSQGTENVPTMNEDNNALSQRTIVAEARDARHQEARRERKVIEDPPKEQTTVELAPENVDYQHEQTVPLGKNQCGLYNGRFQRGHDTGYRDRDLVHDFGKQNFHMNGEKQKNNPHLEYQQIGSYHKARDSFQQNPSTGEGAHEGSRAPGSRYRERGHYYPRGGGSGAVAHVGDSYKSGE